LEFQREAEVLRTRIDQRMADIAPIRMVPPEVLYRTFLCLLEPETDTLFQPTREEDYSKVAQRARRLVLVNKQWSSVIQNGAMFWTSCTFKDEYRYAEKIQKWMGRTENLALQAVLWV